MAIRIFGGSPSIYGSGYHTLHSSDNRSVNKCHEFTKYCGKLYTVPRDFLSKQIATPFFYPLLTNAKQEELEFAKSVSTKAWKTYEPCPPFNMSKIKDNFREHEESYRITLDSGKVVSYTVRILESKYRNILAPQENPFFNFVFVSGNHSMKETMLPGIHDYLNHYLEKYKEQRHFSGARMVHITAYDITDEQGNRYFPKSLSEAGFLLKEALCAFQNQYGSIHEIDGHSSGGIFLAVACGLLREANEIHYIPECIFFNRVPDSIYGASKNEWRGCLPVGRIAFPLARMLGWDFDVAGEVNQFYLQFRDRIKQMVILDAELDHRFKGAHLGDDQRITVLQDNHKVRIIKFKILGTHLNEAAQHGIGTGKIFGWNTTEQFSQAELATARSEKERNVLIEQLKFVKAGETVTAAILNASLCKKVDSVVDNKMRERSSF